MKKYLFFACITCIVLIFASCDKNGASDNVTIYGNVIDRTTGLPLYNVLVQEKNKVGGSTATGNDGNYEFTLPLEGSSSGNYYLIASKDKYATSEYELDMDKVDKNRRVKVDFQLTKESITYSGKVLDSQNQPIVDALISADILVSHTWQGFGTTSVTDINGSYSLDLPRPHEYNKAVGDLLDQWQIQLTASKSGYADVVHVLNQNADDLGKTILVNFVVGSNMVTVSGRVTTGSSIGAALADAYLEVYSYKNFEDDCYEGSAMTDQSGKFSIFLAPYSSSAYTYYFNMSKEGYKTQTKTLQLSTTDIGKSYTLDFILQKQ